MAFELNKFMALMIAEALVPVFFVIFLGYLAGARRIIDNQHLASLIVLLMTFAVPVAAFVGVAQTSRRGLQEDGNAYPQFSGKRHYVNGSNFSDFANEMRAHDLLQISGLADLVYVGWELLPWTSRCGSSRPPCTIRTSSKLYANVWLMNSLVES